MTFLTRIATVSFLRMSLPHVLTDQREITDKKISCHWNCRPENTFQAKWCFQMKSLIRNTTKDWICFRTADLDVFFILFQRFPITRLQIDTVDVLYKMGCLQCHVIHTEFLSNRWVSVYNTTICYLYLGNVKSCSLLVRPWRSSSFAFVLHPRSFILGILAHACKHGSLPSDASSVLMSVQGLN